MPVNLYPKINTDETTVLPPRGLVVEAPFDVPASNNVLPCRKNERRITITTVLIWITRFVIIIIISQVRYYKTALCLLLTASNVNGVL